VLDITSPESSVNKSFSSLRFPHSLCPSEDVFNSSGNRKQGHSEALAVLLCIVHALPRACSSRPLLYQIFNPGGHLPCHWMSWNFHHYWTLNGWNDDIIQSARDAVLQYYKVHFFFKKNGDLSFADTISSAVQIDQTSKAICTSTTYGASTTHTRQFYVIKRVIVGDSE